MVRKWIIRWLLTTMILGFVGFAIYTYLYTRASDGMRAEALKIVDDMMVQAELRPILRGLVEEAHDEAFSTALNINEKLGRKFNAPRYLDRLFDKVVTFARERGHERLANSVEHQRSAFTIEVTER